MEELQKILENQFNISADEQTILCVLQELGYQNLSEISQEDLQGISDRVLNALKQKTPEPVAVNADSSEVFYQQLRQVNHYHAQQQAGLMLQSFNEVPQMTSGYFLKALLDKQDEIKNNPQSIKLHISLAQVLGTEALSRNQMIAFLAPFLLIAIVLLFMFIPRGRNEYSPNQNAKTEFTRSSYPTN